MKCNDQPRDWGLGDDMVNKGTSSILALLMMGILSLAGCNKAQDAQMAQSAAGDPASGNLAPVSDQTQAQPAPQPVDQSAPQPAPQPPSYQGSYAPNDAASYSGEETAQAPEPPPPLPEYSQPPCPGENYIWNPGYWAYAQAGYYWVPGTWVLAPYVGALWTPPYWAYSEITTSFMPGTGARISASTVESITDSATPATATTVATGKTAPSITTARLPM